MEVNFNKTIYQKDFVPHKTPKIAIGEAKQAEFDNPITESFKIFLEKDEKQPQKPNEHCQEFYSKIAKSRPKVNEIHFRDGFDEKLINADKNISVYFKDYGEPKKKQIEELHHSEEFANRLTTYRWDYRKPQNIFQDVHKEIKVYSRICSNQIFGHQTDHSTTGQSEYNDRISQLGDTIIKQQYHGPIYYDF